MLRTNNVLSISLMNARNSHKGHDDRHGREIYDDATLEKRWLPDDGLAEKLSWCDSS